jgi:formylglycine-generating enzyme required for sulfatase activity
MISNTHQSHNPIVYLLVFLPLLGACASSADPDNFGPRVLKDCDVCPELIRIEPGEFQMGLAEGEIVQPGFPKGQELQELPAHRVQIDYPFAIGRYEVSIGEFAAFAAATDFDGKGCLVLIGKDKDWALSPDADFRAPGYDVTTANPAACLSYNDSAAYLQWLSTRTGQTYRFPTEAEWEYVVRSGLGDEPVPSYLGAQACEHLNGSDATFSEEITQDWNPGLFECDDGYAHTAPVGSYQPNKLGMYDVFGNVSEWTEDCFGGNHEGAPTDGSARRREPCPLRILKGGTSAGGPGYLRPSRRGGYPIHLRGDGHGLRVVRELER